MNITSTAFQSNSNIPNTYTCDGGDHIPPLTFSEIPSNTKSLALIVVDPDSPARHFTHWLIYNMPPTTTQILENELPEDSLQGKNDFGKKQYGGPCPINGSHRYFFKLYALDTFLDLSEGASKSDLEYALEGHTIESCELIGIYQRS